MIGPEFHGGGHPWHGLCTAGVLALPNATTKTYPQPSGGDCFKLAVPGHAAPVRNTAQLADDAAQGLQWLGHALVSGDSSAGGGLQVYGKPVGLNCWIWAVSPSKKWKVNAAGLTVSAGVLSGNLLLTEFGRFRPDGSQPESHSLAISAPAGVNSAVKLKILDMSIDGASALIGLYAFADGTHQGSPLRPLPAAVVEIALVAGQPVAVSVVQIYNDSQIAATSANMGALIDGTARPQTRATCTFIPDYGSGNLTAMRAAIYQASTGGLTWLDVYCVLNGVSTTPPNTTEYVQPTQASVHLAGSASCPGGNTVFAYDFVADVLTMDEILAQAQAVRDARQAEVTAGQANVYQESFVDSNCSPNAVVLLENAFAGANNYAWTIELAETLHGTGVDAYKTAAYQVIEHRDNYDFTFDANGCRNAAVFLGRTSTVYGGSADAGYFKKNTTGATGAVNWYYRTTQPACTAPQYLYAPDISTAGGSPVYTWNFTGTFNAVIDGVTTLLGTQTFTYANDIPSTASVGFVGYMLNQPDKGNADRFEFYINHPSPINATQRESAACEAVFGNPCAGVYTLSLVNRLGGTAQANYLHKIVKRPITVQPWAGWSADGPHDHNMTLHPVTLTVASTTPTQPDPQQPVVPAAALCFV